jgi:8-amino-7-oxononanoate synthase
MDLFDKAQQYTIAREAEEGGYYPYFIPLTESEGSQASYQGRTLIMCGSNNYLGLTTHPKVKQASVQAIETYGILDKEDHASIVDGARLGFGDTRRYRHNDMSDLERVLAGVPGDKGKLVVVDGLFSMGGDLADLPRITDLCKRYGARLMVDDAHAMGVLGGGRGTAQHFGLTDQVDLIMSTFSKSFASIGGFVAGDDQVVHYIKHHARVFGRDARRARAHSASQRSR